MVFSGTKVGLINARMSRNRGKRRKRSDRRRWCVLVVEVVGKAAGVAAGMAAAEGVKGGPQGHHLHWRDHTWSDFSDGL